MLTFTNKYLRIIDFKNIIYMDDKYISIMFNKYIIKINGSNLEITTYGYKEIIIRGKVFKIEFI